MAPVEVDLSAPVAAVCDDRLTLIAANVDSFALDEALVCADAPTADRPRRSATVTAVALTSRSRNRSQNSVNS